MCAKTLQSSRNFPIVCAKLIAKTHTNFQLSLQNSTKFHTNVHLIVQKLCKTTHKFPILCGCNWVPRKLLRTPCEVFFLQFKETRTAELWGGCMWWENFFLQKFFKFVFSQNFKNPPNSFKLQRSMHQARTPCNFYLVSQFCSHCFSLPLPLQPRILDPNPN